MKVKKKYMAFLVTICLVAVQLVGRAAIGPPTVDRDRFDYVTAISESWKRQTLLKLLKTRYLDAPVFMDVTSVINQYALESEITLNFSWQDINTQGLEGRGMYTDRPTITYSPLMGENYARSLLKPLPVSAILILAQADYPADVVFRICLSSINGLKNNRYRFVDEQMADPAFYEMLDLFRSVFDAGGIAMRSREINNKTKMVLIFRQAMDAAQQVHVDRLKNLLGLNSDVWEFPVVHGRFAVSDQEIAVLCRSMLQVMVAYSSFIEVPASDLLELRVRKGWPETGVGLVHHQPLLRVHHASSEPEDAFSAVPYRGHWFWIDDRDIHSKTMFNFLLALFSFTERGRSEPEAPVITVPTN